MNIKTLEITADEIIRNRNDFSKFEIINLPSTFALGKSSIKFRVRDGGLLLNSGIGFVAEDYYGKRISYDVLDFIDENGCRIIALDITKKTAVGIATIAFYGTMPNEKIAAMILEVPIDKSDVVSIAPMYINAPNISITEITASVIDVEIPQVAGEGETFVDDPTYTVNTRRRVQTLDIGEATYRTSKNTSGGRSDTDVSKRFQRLSTLDDGGANVLSGEVLYMDSSETFITAGNSIFNRNMVGGKLHIGKYETNIIEVYSDTSVKVYPPAGYSERDTADLSYTIVSGSSVTIEYNDDVITATGSARVESFLKMELTNLSPDSGDLARVEVLGKGVGSLNPSQVFTEFELENQSILVDNSRVYVDSENGGRFGSIGVDFLDYEFDNYWKIANITATKNYPNPAEGFPLLYDKGTLLETSADAKITTIGYYPFSINEVYRLTARFDVVDNQSGINDIYITLPARNVRTNEMKNLPTNYNDFLLEKNIDRESVLFAHSLVSGSVVVDELFVYNGPLDSSSVEVLFDSSGSTIQMQYIDIERSAESHRPPDSYTAIVPLSGVNTNSEYNFKARFKSSHGLYSKTETSVNGFMVSGQEVGGGSGSLQTLSYDSETGNLSISGGNTVTISVPPGSGDLHEVVYFTGSASTSWSGSHSLAKIPAMEVFTYDGSSYVQSYGSIVGLDSTGFEVNFRYSQQGYVILN